MRVQVDEAGQAELGGEAGNVGVGAGGVDHGREPTGRRGRRRGRMGRMAQTTPHPDLASALADITLPAAAGGDVRLGDLWSDRTAILVHLRHFG